MMTNAGLANEKGAAFIEYLVVLVLIGLVSFVGYPALLQGIDSLHTDQATTFSSNTSYPPALIP